MRPKFNEEFIGKLCFQKFVPKKQEREREKEKKNNNHSSFLFIALISVVAHLMPSMPLLLLTHMCDVYIRILLSLLFFQLQHFTACYNLDNKTYNFNRFHVIVIARWFDETVVDGVLVWRLVRTLANATHFHIICVVKNCARVSLSAYDDVLAAHFL